MEPIRLRNVLRPAAAILNLACALCLAALLAPSPCWAVAPTSVELGMTDTWVRENFLSATRLPPFSFKYNGAASSSFLGGWSRQQQETSRTSERVEYTITWTEPNSGIEIRCELVEHFNFPVAEWTVYVRNGGTQNTGIFQDILALDMSLTRTTRSEFVLNGIQGDFTTADSYKPFQLTLVPGFSKTFSPPSISGKSSDGPDGWPYWNLQMPGGGVILACGWPGQWACTYTRVGQTGLSIKAGQQLTRMYLKPGEEIRTPRMAMLFWRGDDVVRSQNIWRRWYVADVLPHFLGNPQPPVQQIQVSGYQASNLYYFLTKGIVPDICWRDAGWYPTSQGPYTGADSWLNTGTWEIDPNQAPQGFRAFSDYAHSVGSSFLLWWEPERVGSPNSFLGMRPQWLLPGTSTTVGDILNLGNPDALSWLIDHIDNMIITQGIDWYREDMNGNGPLPAWRNHDASNRQGMTENLYVQGHLTLWDSLKARHWDLHIDSCASGGRRNDLETMRRAVPLVRSDFQFPNMTGVVDGNQCHTYGLSSWLPFQGNGCYFYDVYAMRSFYGACWGMGGLTEDNAAAQQQSYAENDIVAPYMLFGDYYPLTPYSLADNVWIGWQFDRPEADGGCVQVFRRQNAASGSITLQLQGLDPAESYDVRNFDSPSTQRFTGQALMTTGLSVTLPARGSAIFEYKVVVPAPQPVTGRPRYRPKPRSFGF
jgi:alpha-galactosidase